MVREWGGPASTGGAGSGPTGCWAQPFLSDLELQRYRLSMIGSLEMIVIDCPDPREMARFYSQLVGADIVGYDENWAEIAMPGANHPLAAFQQVSDYSPPEWPSQSAPQQMHLDVRIEDFDTAEAAVLAIGATATGAGTESYRVYLDPAGHPFCLIKPSD